MRLIRKDHDSYLYNKYFKIPFSVTAYENLFLPEV